MTPEEKVKIVLGSFRYGGLSRGTHIVLSIDKRPVKVEKVE